MENKKERFYHGFVFLVDFALFFSACTYELVIRCCVFRLFPSERCNVAGFNEAKCVCVLDTMF